MIVAGAKAKLCRSYRLQTFDVANAGCREPLHGIENAAGDTFI